MLGQEFLVVEVYVDRASGPGVAGFLPQTLTCLQNRHFFVFLFWTSHEGTLSLPVAGGDYLQFHVYCAQQWQAAESTAAPVSVISPAPVGVQTHRRCYQSNDRTIWFPELQESRQR